jgi:acyl-CoA hydrolase
LVFSEVPNVCERIITYCANEISFRVPAGAINLCLVLQGRLNYVGHTSVNNMEVGRVLLNHSYLGL